MRRNLFEFQDYRAYLANALPTRGAKRGARTQLANLLGVQKGFVSSVIHGSAELTLEQAFRASEFLAHTLDEREYFLLLVQKARAGSRELEAHFSAKIQETALRRREIKERIQAQAKITESDQLVYYSSWHYTAIHMCLRVPATRTASSIARFLGLPVRRVSDVLEFFVKSGIAVQNGDTFSTGPARIHLPSDSPLVAKHHSNWRMQAVQALDRKHREDLHYSSVMSISRQAANQIRDHILRMIQELEPVIRDANDEGVYTLTVDLFSLMAES